MAPATRAGGPAGETGTPEVAAPSLAAPASIALVPGSFAARGPITLSLAAEPRGLRAGLQTGFPLGLARPSLSRPLQGAAGAWRVDALLDASRGFERGHEPLGVGTALRVERADTRGATWWGVSRGGLRDPDDPGDPEARLRLAAGRLQALGGVRAEVAWITSSVLFRDDPRWFHTHSLRYFTPYDTGSGYWTDSTWVDHDAHAAWWNTAQGSLRWQRGRLALESVGGLSMGDGVRARRWAQASFDVLVSRHVLLVGSFGERPAPSLAFQSGAQPHTMLGLQWAPWSARGWGRSGAPAPAAVAWQARAAGPDRVLIRVHGRDVSRVEVAGDFTDWTPVALMPLHGNWWGAVVRVAPGVHRVQLRLDGGAWLAPPGLPRADDGPGGPSGTWIVGG